MSKPTIRSFMTPNPITIGSHDTLAAARARMRMHKVRHLPVIEDDASIGIVSARDLDAIERYHDVNPERVEVYEAMAPCPFEIGPDTPLEEVVAAMADNRYGSALVVEDGKLLGIFTTVDALRAILRRPSTSATRRSTKTARRHSSC